MNTRQFIIELFDAKPPESYIVIWTLNLLKPKDDPQRNYTAWFMDIDKAVDYIQKQKNKTLDVYFGCGLQAKNLGPKRRGEKKDIIGITGFWADIDIADDKTHKKQNYPTTTVDALTLVKGYGYDPNIIVHSGHGIHCWWLFKEPWLFKDDKDRETAEHLSQRMQMTILQRATEKKWTIDSTWELTRVLRPVGTINHKTTPVPVEIYEYENKIRYEDPIKLEKFLVDESHTQYAIRTPLKEKIKVANGVTIDPAAEPPADMLDMLCEADSKFKASWHNKRSDMKDTSPSGYALSLATLSMRANWSDQEVTDLIIAFYRRHGYDLNKACRPDFIGGTLEVARKSADREFIDHYLKTIEPAQHTKYASVVDPKHKKAKDFVRKTLGMDIAWIKKFPEEKKAFFQMLVRWKEKIEKKTEDNKVIEEYIDVTKIVNFEKAEDLTTQKKFRNRVFEVLNYMPPKLKPDMWEKVVGHFPLFVIEHISDSPESGDIKKRIQAWIRDYLEDKPQLTAEDHRVNREPFVHIGHWYIDKHEFHSWSWSQKGNIDGEKVTKLHMEVADIVFQPLNIKNKNAASGRTKIRPWKVPLEVSNPKDQPDPDIEDETEPDVVDLDGYKNKKEA